jgi:hypothetical protein
MFEPLPITTRLENRVPWACKVAAGTGDEEVPDLVSGEARGANLKILVPRNTIKALSEADREAILKVILDKRKKFT